MPTEPSLEEKKAEAIRRAREARSRAHPVQAAPMQAAPTQAELPIESSQKAGPPTAGLEALFKDPERTLLLVLLLLFQDEGRDPQLLFAILYLLI